MTFPATWAIPRSMVNFGDSTPNRGGAAPLPARCELRKFRGWYHGIWHAFNVSRFLQKFRAQPPEVPLLPPFLSSPRSARLCGFLPLPKLDSAVLATRSYPVPTGTESDGIDGVFARG